MTQSLFLIHAMDDCLESDSNYLSNGCSYHLSMCNVFLPAILKVGFPGCSANKNPPAMW